MTAATSPAAATVYEGMFLLDPGKYGRDPEGVTGAITEMISHHGGRLLAARVWDERKLAYPVKGIKKGVYWLTYFHMPAEGIAPLERQCRLSDEILRQLILKMDPRIAEAIIQHIEHGEAEGERPGR